MVFSKGFGMKERKSRSGARTSIFEITALNMFPESTLDDFQFSDINFASKQFARSALLELSSYGLFCFPGQF